MVHGLCKKESDRWPRELRRESFLRRYRPEGLTSE